ncbi:MAG: FkbM family methyltransferase [Euryarchaeota archaeon TMED85]|nr:MAG: FkbM family methyltransferase [Euryarchaeota archaeon TMED85]|tara:strand:+ start:18363 stop:19106 length:744 start_codon:yes stop_codon:yes gene_type:complete
MIAHIFYYLIKGINKIAGLSFGFSHDGEDLILLKYLSNIKRGKYIDIGSNFPVSASNTFLLYLYGWNGVCIDPLPFLKQKYRLIRSRDKFINAAVFGSRNINQKDLKFYYYKNIPGNSTFDQERVEHLRKNFNREPTSIINVPKISIRDILTSFDDKEKTDINLLNLDIEGFEIDILNEFFYLKKFPWVICVEEIGKTADSIKNGEIYKIMKNNGYILGARTFLSSIYVLNKKLYDLPSDFIKELEV